MTNQKLLARVTKLVKAHPAYKVVGVSRDSRQTKELILSQHPSICIFGGMPEALKWWKVLNKGLPEKVAGAWVREKPCEGECIQELLRQGITGYFMTEWSDRSFKNALGLYAKQRRLRPRPILEALADEVAADGNRERSILFSPGQRRVAKLLRRQYHPKGMAARLGIALNTVQVHLKAIYEKLNVHTAEEARRKLIHLGL